ncbi:MAG TPA: FUSC family protein [Nocardioides sp.]|nr:FUSC family protein [Nocardioides sp.]
MHAALHDRAHATRVSLGLVIPGIVLLWLDRPALLIFAVFGSFAGMYGRAESRSVRLLHQSQGALLLLGGTAVGIVLSRTHAAPPTVVVVATIFALGGSLLADFFALRPEGPFYGTFALGAIAGVSAIRATPWECWGIAAASAALAIVIGLVAADPTRPDRITVVAAVRGQRDRERQAAFLHAARYVLAIAAAGAGAYALGLGHVNWAIAGAAVTLAAADPRGRLRRGIQRVVGTLAGLAVTALVLAPGLPPRTLAIIVICLIFPTELFMSVNYALALSFFTPMIMLMTELAQPIGVRELITSRALGTMVGVVVGVVVTALVRDPRSWSGKDSDVD